MWDPVIDHTSFLPGATLDILLITALPANLDLASPLGTLLCDVISSPPALLTTTPGTPFAVPVPPNCNLAGLTLSTEGLSQEGLYACLTNALDITIGH